MKSTSGILKNYSFLGLLSGQALTILGDILYIVALIPLIYKTTGSVASTALVPFFSSGAQFISGMLAPTIIDKLPLKSMILYFQALKSVALLGLYFTSGWLEGHIEFIFIFVIAISFLNGWIGPARSALIPIIVERDQLVKANGMLSTTNQVVYLSGYSLGGVFVAFAGSDRTLLVTGIIYVISLLLYRIIKPKITVQNSKENQKAPWLDRMKEGWEEIGKKPALRRTLMMDIVETLANGVWTAALMLVFVQEFLHKDESWWGFLNSGYYIGTITGGMIAIGIANWLRRNLGLGMVLGGSLMAAYTMMFAIIPIPFIAFLLCIAMGPAYQIRDIAQNTLFQTVAEEKKLAKVNAARDTLVYALFGVAVLIMAQVSEWFNVNAAYVVAAILYGTSAIIGLGLLKGSKQVVTEIENNA